MCTPFVTIACYTAVRDSKTRFTAETGRISEREAYLMKRHLTAVIAVILAFVMAFADPVRVLAEDPQIYISDLKVGMGKKASDAENALKGYTIITGADGEYVDFNDNAGGGWASKGEKVVYIGYRTTGSKDEAITDIALMNMKGGYKTEDYDALMEDYINIQIIPFVESFISAIREYRENLNSPYPANRERAERIREALNKLGVGFVQADIMSEEDAGHHDPVKLRDAVMKMVYGLGA